MMPYYLKSLHFSTTALLYLNLLHLNKNWIGQKKAYYHLAVCYKIRSRHGLRWRNHARWISLDIDRYLARFDRQRTDFSRVLGRCSHPLVTKRVECGNIWNVNSRHGKATILVTLPLGLTWTYALIQLFIHILHSTPPGFTQSTPTPSFIIQAIQGIKTIQLGT